MAAAVFAMLLLTNPSLENCGATSPPLPKNAENSAFDNENPVTPSADHTNLIATFRRAQADAAHKSGLIKTAANKGPKAIAAAVDAAAKAAKRRDSYAKKLSALGVELKD